MLAHIGGFLLMSWQQVVICTVFVLVGGALGIAGKETLAATAIAAAAGYLVQPVLRSNGNGKGRIEPPAPST